MKKLLKVILVSLPCLLAGCLIGEPRKQWDLESSRLDQELTIKAITSTPGSPEKRFYEDRRNDLNYKWYIDLREPETDVYWPGEIGSDIERQHRKEEEQSNQIYQKLHNDLIRQESQQLQPSANN